MKKTGFNEDWLIQPGMKGPFDDMAPVPPTGTAVTLPHDAMIYEERDQTVASGKQTGYYPAKNYTYIKEFFVPEEWKKNHVILEFEGVAQHAQVFLNGERVAEHLNPYTGFYVETDELLKFGENNSLKVLAISSDLSSRWYPGAGIFRPVVLHMGGKIHIVPDGVKIVSEVIEENFAVLGVSTIIRNADNAERHIRVEVKVNGPDGIAAIENSWVTVKRGKTCRIHQRLSVESPRLWDTEHPDLYRVEVFLYEENGMSDTVELLDIAEEMTGIRKLTLDAKYGLRLNGKQVKLRGTCIHHDNGILGACTLEKAEEYRCRKLKEAGFNSIRSAHNPISKEMLRACDRIGMLVMDELSDMWLEPKNPHDYAQHFKENWECDVEAMVAKDFNHPSVILYSIGNEIPDLVHDLGKEWNCKLAGKVKELDVTRYITNSLNGCLLLGKNIGVAMADALGVTMEEMIAMAGQQANKIESVGNGIDEMNHLMGGMPPELWKLLGTSNYMDAQIKEIAGSLDVTGLNYMAERYEIDCENYPNRIMVGSETYPADIVTNWPIVEKHPNILGDFSWTGYDYLGEAGIGDYAYVEGGNASGEIAWPERTASCGDLDLIGYRRPISYLREIVFGIRKEPYIAVERMNRYGKELYRTAWAYKMDVIGSYTWNGFEGRETSVDVFSADEEVELFVNGKSQGKQPAGREHGYTASWIIQYEPGELAAVGYHNGVETGRMVLKTANNDVQLSIKSSTHCLKADGADLAFITVNLVDKDGNENLQEKRKVAVQIEGAGTLQGYGSANPCCEGSYQDLEWETYDGYVMAVVRSGRKEGTVKVTFAAEGCDDQSIEIQVQKA